MLQNETIWRNNAIFLLRTLVILLLSVIIEFVNFHTVTSCELVEKIKNRLEDTTCQK
jgi:hypothetical protein